MDVEGELMMLSRPRNGPTANGRGGLRTRAPLSSVNANLVHKDNANINPRTPHNHDSSNYKTPSKKKAAATFNNSTTKKKKKTATTKSTAKKKRPKHEIYTPVLNSSAQNKNRSGRTNNIVVHEEPNILVEESAIGSTVDKPTNEDHDFVTPARSQAIVGHQLETSISSAPPVKRVHGIINLHDKSIPVVNIGSSIDQPVTVLNFGYKSNIVGKMRSLPFQIDAPPSSLSSTNSNPKFVTVEFEHIPFQSGFEVILEGYDVIKQEYVACNVKSVGDTKDPTIIQLKQAESKILHVLWKPKAEGEIREEICLKTSMGKVQIALIGIAKSLNLPKQAKSIAEDVAKFYGRENTTYDAQQWEDHQCTQFTGWLNNLFHPEGHACPMNEQQLAEEWQAARQLFDSPRIRATRCAIEKEVKEGRLAMTPRSNRNILDEVHVQEQLTQLLLSYSPRWLQLGLDIVLAINDESAKVANQVTRDSLKKIIKQRVFSEPHTIRKYTGNVGTKMRVAVHQHALSQIMTLVFFLDKAKANRVLTQDPCLFEKSSAMKSSEEVLVSLFQDCFSKQGSIIRHLDYGGVSVSHVQHPLDEYDFFVKNLAVDLKDGVSLAKMIDIVTEGRFNLLSSLRLPTTSRQYKTHNVNLALSALRRLGVQNISDVTTAHIVNAHQPRILQLLWSNIIHFELSEFKQEIIHYKAARMIQCHVRGFLFSRSYRLARHGTELCQALYRGFNVRITLMRMTNAATILQKMWRGYKAKLSYGRVRMNIITIQSVCRRFVTRNQVDKMSKQMNSGSTEIQRIWRGYDAKVTYGLDLMNIITSQSVCRRFIAQKQFERMSRSMNNASIEIQRVWRGYRAKIHYGFDMLDIITVQSVCRRFIARNQVARLSMAMGNASVTIQKRWRGYTAQLRYGFDLMDIIRLQSMARSFLARKKVARQYDCARKIQNIVRMWAARRIFVSARKGICAIQGHVRRVLASMHARYLKSHVVNLQRVCRGWLCRQLNTLSKSVTQDVAQALAMPLLCNRVRNDEETTATHAAHPMRTSTTPCSNNFPKQGLACYIQVPEPAANKDSTSLFSVMPDDQEIYFTSRQATSRRQGLGEVALITDEITHFQSPERHQDTEDISYYSAQDSMPQELSPVGKNVYLSNEAERLISDITEADDANKSEAYSSPIQQNIDIHCPSTQDSPELVGNDNNDEEIYFTTKHGPRQDFHPIGRIAHLDDTFEEVPVKEIEEASLAEEHSSPEQIQSTPNNAPSIGMDEDTATILIQEAWRQHRAFKSFLAKTREEKDKEEHAATMISSAYRAHTPRRNFKLTLASIVTIQRHYRGHRGRLLAAELKNLADLHREQSAIVIQTPFRRHVCKSHYAAQRLGTTSLQARARGLLVRTADSRRDNAATMIQKTYRGYIPWENYVVTKFAAILIQGAARRHLLNQSAKFKLRREILLGAVTLQQTQSTAAVQIQRLWRGYMAQVDFILLLLATIKIQSSARGGIAVMQRQRSLGGVVLVQAVFRGSKARNNFAIMEGNAVIIQAAARKLLVRLMIQKAIGAALTLQRASRDMISRINNEVECFAATEIQRVWRGHRLNVRFVLLTSSAIKTQALIRGKQVRHTVDIQRKAISTLQRATKTMLSRINSEVECFAATEIQRVWRGYNANVAFMLGVLSIIQIQAVVRGGQARRVIAMNLASTLNLQRVSRGFLARAKRRKMMSAVVTLQRSGKAMLSLAKTVRIAAATDIQRAWRGYRLNVQYMYMVVSAITIQSFARQTLARKALAKELVKHRLAVEAEKVRRERALLFAKQRQRAAEALRSKEVEEPNICLASQANREGFINDKKPNSALSFSSSASEPAEPNGVHVSLKSRKSKASGPQVIEVKGLSNTLVLVPSPQEGTNQSAKFARHTTKAIRIVQQSKKFSEVLKAFMKLEKITHQSIDDCKLIVDSSIQDKMFSIIRSCNRSSPHIELIRVILSVLGNIALHPSLLSQLANVKALDALTDLVQLFRDKSNIFALSSCLLEQILLHNSRFMSSYSTQENKKRLRGILLLCQANPRDEVNRGVRSLANVIRMFPSYIPITDSCHST